MPRLQPTPGYVTAKDAAEMLQGSDAMLSRYVREGRLKRYGPPERKHKFYKISEIEAVIEARNTFEAEYTQGKWRENPTSKFELAQEADMPDIARIGTAIFRDAKNPIYQPTPIETRLSWMRKNPETYHALRSQNGTLLGYICILPLRKEIINQWILDKIKTTDITANEIELFVPGHPIHIYVMAMCVDPAYNITQKHEYGARLVAGLYSFLLDLADRGVEIETISARSYKTDGVKLLKKIGIPQLRSPIPNKNLFSVNITESGIPLLMRYSRRLDQWKQEHSPNSSG
jgi:hypothetical protein